MRLDVEALRRTMESEVTAALGGRPPSTLLRPRRSKASGTDKQTGANGTRPITRILVAYRDGGICGWCGQPFTASGGAGRELTHTPDGRPKKGRILSGENYPTIDHLWPWEGRATGYQLIPGEGVRYGNLCTLHSRCNAEKKDGVPTDLMAEQANTIITPAMEQEAEKVLEECFGLTFSDLKGDDARADGRRAAREVAVEMGRRLITLAAEASKKPKRRRSRKA